ncbi:cysteine desulfurase family protein [Streptosporangium sp. G11]|uniref:cysteine desulfurase family protein n=1 Tax=Streptosporangium sp. G11 TaxID=3436926 RepID=UPI003EBBB167
MKTRDTSPHTQHLGQAPMYFDYAASTPVDGRVLQAMLPYFTQEFGNASNVLHNYGKNARRAVIRSLELIASSIGATAPDQIIVTPSATSANWLAMVSAGTAGSKPGHIITSPVEHSSVIAAARHLEKIGGAVTWLEVNSNGLVNTDQLKKEIRQDTALVSIGHVNNETGVCQDIESISHLCMDRGVTLHTDATQSFGKTGFRVDNALVSMATFSAHKIYGPIGIGCLYVRNNTATKISVPGDYSATANVPSLVGFATAAELTASMSTSEISRIKYISMEFLRDLHSRVDVQLNGSSTNRTWDILNLSIRNIDGADLARAAKIAISTGSACRTGSREPSPTLHAMGLDIDRCRSAVRVSFGRFTTATDAGAAVDEIQKVVSLLRD